MTHVHCSGLPSGYIPSDEILNSELPTLPPPAAIHYTEKHVRLDISRTRYK